jgi:ABC-type branched-subunit amino acid transport system substrate-binding protein
MDSGISTCLPPENPEPTRNGAGDSPRLKFLKPRLDPLNKIACVALAGVLCSGLASMADPVPLRIGFLLPPMEAEAMSLRQGVELAVQQARESYSGPFELVIRGRVGQWGDDGVEAARMVLDDSVQGLLAPPDGEATHLTLQVAGRTAVPVVSLCSDSSVTDAGIPWSVRAVPGTEAEAHALFTGLQSEGGIVTWIAIVPGKRAGREIRRDLTAAAQSAGVELITTVEVPGDTIDYSILYPSFPKEWPDGILLWLDPEKSGHMSKYIRTLGFKGVLAGPGRLDSMAFRNAAGSAMEGVILSMVQMEKSARCASEQFQRLYLDQYQQLPDWSAAMAYDGARLLIGLLRRAGDNPPHELFPLGQMEGGVTGPLWFDDNGNRITSFQLQVYHQGELAPLVSCCVR